MNKNYEALKDFEAPGNGGAISKGQALSLPAKLGELWVRAGLIKETKTDSALKGKEVKTDGN